MATMPFKRFEKSKADKEPKGAKEGSRKEEAMDRRQMAGAKGKAAGKPPMKKRGC